MYRICFTVALFVLVGGAAAFSQEPPKDLKLFLLIGQSNMAGRGKIEAQDKVENPSILMLTKDLKWVIAKDPVHFDKGSAGVGLCSEFARDLHKADPGCRIGLIPCAMGGSSLSQWQPGEPLYVHAVTRSKEAMKQGTLTGILWHQGESDAKPELVATYPARFATMITQLRKDLGAEQVPVLIGEVIPGHGNHDAVNVALAETARNTPKAALVSSAGLGKKQLHYDAADYRTLGKRYAEVWLKMVTP
ncbi:MAG: Carbohydrate acetyl esterase/feruloyl esterase precursor [Verrucomicrobiota bacterium]|jgi:hypothetical protein